MTIFSEIVRGVISNALEEVKRKSSAADKSSLNKVGSMIFLGRDKNLAKNKRKLATNLSTEVSNKKDCNCDKETYDAFIEMLQNCVKTATEMCQEKNHNEGTFGKQIENVVLLVMGIYTKFKEVELLDKEHDDDPLNIFRYHIARYFAEKEEEARNPNLKEYISQHSKTLNELSKQKQRFLRDCLGKCENALEELDTKRETYENSRCERVKEWVREARRQNADAIKSCSTQFKVPITLTMVASVEFGLPKLGPKTGFIEQCLNDAIKEIEEVQRKMAPKKESSTKKNSKPEVMKGVTKSAAKKEKVSPKVPDNEDDDDDESMEKEPSDTTEKSAKSANKSNTSDEEKENEDEKDASENESNEHNDEKSEHEVVASL